MCRILKGPRKYNQREIKPSDEEIRIYWTSYHNILHDSTKRHFTNELDKAGIDLRAQTLGKLEVTEVGFHITNKKLTTKNLEKKLNQQLTFNVSVHRLQIIVKLGVCSFYGRAA